jgi:hypothetical protein
VGIRYRMLTVSPEALRQGCERAQDLFALNRLRDPGTAGESFDAVFASLGFDDAMRARLHGALAEIVPVQGAPVLEATATMSMLAGALVGLLIAESALPADELDLPVVVS